MHLTNGWMKTCVIGLTLVLALQSSPLIKAFSQDDKTQDETLVLVEGTAFKLVTAQEVSSKTAQVGDAVAFKVEEDVVVKNRVLISKGTPAKGVVVNAEKSGRMGKAGKLGVRVESTTTVDGQPLRLRATRGKEGDDKTVSVGLLSSIVSPLFLLKKGEDARIKEGAQFKVYVAEEKRFQDTGSTLVALPPAEQQPADASAAAVEGALIDNSGVEDRATVYIYRPSKMVGKALEPSVFCDGVELARMDNGRYLTLKLKPGKHIIHMTDKKKGFEVDMGRGEQYYFRVGIELGMWKGQGKLMLDENERGAAEIKKLKPLGPDKIKDKTMVEVVPFKTGQAAH